MTYKNIFSIPVTQSYHSSMKRIFIIFSALLFFIIFFIGGIVFYILMEQILLRNSRNELVKIIELERLKLEASVNAEIAIVHNMTNSPLIKKYFKNPDDRALEELATEEIRSYRRTLEERIIFWINNYDKIFHNTDHIPYTVDPEHLDNYWYNMTLYETESFNFNINYNPNLNITNLWINAPVFDSENNPIGMLGTGINLSNFISNIYNNYSGITPLYFFNAAGEITGADDIHLVKNKINIEHELGQTGKKIITLIKTIESDEIINFNINGKTGIAAVGSIPALNWYITSIYHFKKFEPLQTGLTLLFIVMMAVVLAVLITFNIFIARLLEPLYNIVKKISQISVDWDLKDQEKIEKKNEIGTLGEFLTMTIIDPLTEIFNRRFFDGNMKTLIKSLSRTGGKLSLLMVDIDFFKKYNDAYGHDMGDKCLKEVSNALSKSITREEDFIARYGGEEFVIVLPNTDENGAALIAEKLLKNVLDCKIPHKENEVSPYVTVSAGGTTGFVKHSHNENDYVKPADIALYNSKNNGRNQYSFEKFIAQDE